MQLFSSKWVDVGAVAEVPVRGARVVKTPLGCVAVFRTADDKIFVLEDRCPHAGGPLSQGIVHGASVTCPLHNWVISLETGEVEGPDEGRTLAVPSKVENGRILLSRDALAARKAA